MFPSFMPKIKEVPEAAPEIFFEVIFISFFVFNETLFMEPRYLVACSVQIGQGKLEDIDFINANNSPYFSLIGNLGNS